MVNTQVEIAELEERLRQADIKADPAVIDQLFADDAAITGRDGKVFTKLDVIKAHQPAGWQRVTRIDLSDLEIRDHGASAVVTGRMDLVDPGFPAALRFTRVWMKRGGRWQIVAGHVSPISAWSSLPEYAAIPTEKLYKSGLDLTVTTARCARPLACERACSLA